MEAHGEVHGWDARYPVTGYTREVNVADIPDARALLNDVLQSSLLPAAAREFDAFSASSLRVNEALIVKYDAETGNNCLPVHQDFSLLTINVALTDSSAFTGGGTWFQHSGQTLVASRGVAVMHAGGIPHCGVPVASGVRYQLVLFVLSTEHPDVSGRLQAIGAAAGAKKGGDDALKGNPLLDIELSTTALEAACRINPRDAESWSQLAHNRQHRGDLPGAIQAFERVLSLSDRRDFAALKSLAAVRSAQGQPDDALRLLEQALSVGAPPSPSAARETVEAKQAAGVALMDLDRWEDAGLVFESIIEADDESRDVWAALGLAKPIFNAAPPEAIYPDWLEGVWSAKMSFGGYELPAKDLIPREELFADPNVPGFQKVSIALLPDVGKEAVAFEMRFLRDKKGLLREDRVSNLRSAIFGGLGYDAIERIEYKEDPMLPNPFGVNPNRLSLVFARGLTLNAERVELFANSRETDQPRDGLFITSEYLRQVTFSASKTGVPRQVSGEYCHFITYERVADGQARANILTAVYTEPLQLERFFIKAPTRPIIIYSHVLKLERMGTQPARADTT